MKKIFAMILACLMLAALCACGSNGDGTTVDQTNQTTESTAAPETTVPETTVPETTENQPTEDAVTAPVDLAKSCIDKSIDELFALIGEPESSDYAPSCLMEGEDGMLFYDGFIVYTYRLDDTETVVDVE